MKREDMTEKFLPAVIVVILWLDGWFYPLLLLPLLYVMYVEKRGLNTIGFRREVASPSLMFGVVTGAITVAVYLPIFLYYLETLRQRPAISWYTACTDIVWYPLYEEVLYRGFLLGHLIKDSDGIRAPFSKKEQGINLFQTAFFLSIHYHHVTAGMPLVLLPDFTLGFLTGLIFLKTRNLTGCLAAHALTNGTALLLRSLCT